ncbi:hypothetical protein AMELA_G00255920 [Ameiurus melas]|uniref:Selenoprotein W n=1 Tax=Ameiurus melas TaxID=219545 RepID=A0A7J5ZRU2_AMEME|nr:hypothetical protein AMELA_G00255920 [Ameiurus melas]
MSNACSCASLWPSTIFPRLLRLISLTIIEEIKPKRFSPSSNPRSGYIFKPAAYSHCLIRTRAFTIVEMAVKIHIIYWPKAIKLTTLLQDEFPGDVEITSEGTPSRTGWFEVQVNDALVHSKKNGDGFVDNDHKLAKIVSAIENALSK